MVIGFVRMVVTPAERQEFIDAIRSILGPTRASPGCIDAQLTQCVEDENSFTFATRWRDQEHLEAHLQTREFTILLLYMEKLQEVPSIGFHIVSWTAGIEMAAAVRGVPMERRTG